MRRMIPAWIALILALSFATIARAQGTGRISGEILDREGKPYPDVNVEIKNPDTGQTYTAKTDKNGRFQQLGLLSGVYVFTLTNEKDHLDFKVQFRVVQDQENVFKLNFKEVMATAGSERRRSEEARRGRE